jgi:integrase
MQRGEILGLTWARVDFARGVLLLDRTKSGRRREVPMNRAVYAALSALPTEPREGLLFHVAAPPWGTLRYAHLSPDRLRDAVASLESVATAPASAHGQHKVVESPASSP